ncbi:ABC-type amino acid transport substrate-binding protein [Sphingomonas zeicaulis]|uniref:substrate-binding periplasmic protein n=1 Tax=Sphingomonas zeicaulis TaxID=1632740 RepID=UPI003D24DAD3
MLSRRSLLAGLGASLVGSAPGAPAHAAPLAKVRQLGVLRVAAYLDNRPWSWMEGGRLVGIDVEIAQALAARLGVRADIAGLAADESVDDDLRNAVWRGGLLGFTAADVMMHVPFDRTFAARNDQVAIFCPYYRERFALACDRDAVDCEAPPVSYKGKRLAAELDSIPDFYFLGSFGGQLANSVVHFATGCEAVSAVIDRKADVVLASSAQIETVLGSGPAPHVARRKGPVPLLTSPGWDVGMAVKENSRSLADAIEEQMAALAAAGDLAAIFARHHVAYVPALAG